MAEGGGLFHRTMTRFAFFTGGATVCYAFANPDDGNVYDIFPTARSKHAFINTFKVKETEKWSFESKWKNLARYYQQQEGYLYNKLIRSKDTVDGMYQYYAIMQWTTGEAFVKSTGKPSYQQLVGELPTVDRSKPLMYKVVVDDTEFDPDESFAPYNAANK